MSGVVIDALAVLCGGILGSFAGNRLSDEIKENLNIIFGLCAFGMGIHTVVLLKNLPVVVMSMILGILAGTTLHLEMHLRSGMLVLEKPLKPVFTHSSGNMEPLLTVLVLFCASANGIYGSLDAGFSGDTSILVSKAILDFFTAALFAGKLGMIVSLVSVPQFVIYALLFAFSGVLYPLLDETMIADFKGVGGLLMMATGFKLMKVVNFRLADLLPALLLVFPLNVLWVHFVLPML